MLVELIVENYAVVERARIQFHEGLNLLTGETGSGKSIVVDSLALLLGARASSEMIRTGSESARISGIFAVEASPELEALLGEGGIGLEEGEIIAEREISSGGKSRAFVGNRPVTTGFLRQLAPFLADIHGQNEQQLLFGPQAQREMVDTYAGVGELRDQVADLYKKWRETCRKLTSLLENEQEKLRLLDLWRFQKNEIEGAQLKAGEDDALASERKVLQNTTRLQENACSAFELLYESESSAINLLRRAMKRLDDIVRIDESLSSSSTGLKQAEIAMEESAWTLRDYLEKLEADPRRLEDIETRLDALDRLKRKYGGSLEAVLIFHDQVTRQLDEIEHASEHQAALEKEQARLATEYERAANELSGKRRTAAERLSTQVEAELKGLAMAGTRFRVNIENGQWSAAGMDEIEFLVAPNRGEELRPMSKIASGGELSRISLALKSAIGDRAARRDMHTLVFDEVDAGVGGAAAASVGKRLKSLSRVNQVICVTHLAQIAGFADHHYAVSKAEKKGRVITEVRELDREARAREIGRMLSGETITAEALKQAEQLIQAGSA
ncbi:MAG: DNA repair protein RecN [Bryobacteraceae bacterium]